MWCELCSITNYKGRNSSDAQPTASLPDELNTFYTRFEMSNTVPTVRLAEEQDNCNPSLTTADVRRSFKRVVTKKVTKARWHSRPCPMRVCQTVSRDGSGRDC